MTALLLNVRTGGPSSTLTLPDPGTHPSAVIVSDTGVRLVLPYAPREADLGGLSDTWESLERPGRLPIVRRSADGLPTMGFNLILARPDHQDTVEDYVTALRQLADGGGRIMLVNMSPQEAGPWRISDLGISVEQRQHGTNHITRATAAVSLITAVDPVTNLGPVSGGSTTPAPPPKPRYYTTKKGDTFSKISRHFYGTTKYWKLIASKNHVKKPYHLRAGKKLLIPPKP